MSAYVKEVPVTYPLLVGDAGLLPIAAKLGNAVGGLPFTLVIDKKGVVDVARLGIWKEAELAEHIEKLLRQ